MANLHFLDPQPSNEPAVLLLHGLGVDSSSWILQMEPLAEAGFRPIAPDVTGFGASPYTGGGWSVGQAADSMAALLDELKVGASHVVGISMGGVIAQELALLYPAQVQRLVLANTFARILPDSLSGWIYFAERAILAHTLGVPTQARLVAKRLFPEPGQALLRQELIRQVSAADPRAYRAALRALGLYNSTPRLKEIRSPTLVITGDCDSTVPPRNQRVLASGIQGSKQVVVRGAGHAVSVEMPEEFNRIVSQFLQEVAGP
jgi:pimeloyl-ACP methyl ester carboxylesterase